MAESVAQQTAISPVEKPWQFKKGQSGNPGGKPKAIASLIELTRKLTPKCIRVLEECLDSDDERVRVAAANSLIDRAWGKPAQAVAVTGADGAPFAVVIDLSGSKP